jgi:zinc protease
MVAMVTRCAAAVPAFAPPSLDRMQLAKTLSKRYSVAEPGQDGGPGTSARRPTVGDAVLRWVSSSMARVDQPGSAQSQARRDHRICIRQKGAFVAMTRMPVRLVLLSCVLTCFLAGTVSAQQIKPPKHNYEKVVLPNFLYLILHEDHTIPIVEVNLWYHVGSKNEVENRTGFAHLFEHMMFQGSENHNTDFFYALDAIGATDRNGTTNFDRTNYFENVPTSALEQVLWLESDRMGWLLPAMTQERLDNQIEVVKNERRQGVDNQPYGTVDERMYAALYPKAHPYSWDVIGYMEDLTAATKEDVEGFFKEYYGPNNCTLVIAGDIDKATVKEQVEKYFGPIPAGPPVFRKDTWIPELQKEIRLTMEDRVPLPRIYMAWHAPANYAAGEAELDVLSGILANGKTSRLYKRLVYDLQIAQDVTSYVDERELGSLFYVRVTAKEGRTLEEIEPIVREELAAIQAKGVTKLEVERVVTQTLSGKVRGLQRIGGFGGKSDMLARYNTYLGDPDYIEKDFARYNAITPAAVKAAATRWLHEGVCVMSVTPYPEMMASTDTVDRAVKPELTEAPPLTLPQLQRKTLSNGLEVVLAELHKTPLVQFDLQVSGGWSADNKGAYGVASFTSRMQDEGTKKRNALEISEQAQLLGATLGTGSGLDNCSVSMNSLVARLDESLDLFSDVVLNPSFPEEEVQPQRNQVFGQNLLE